MRDSALRLTAIVLYALVVLLIAGCGGGMGNAVTVQTVTKTGLSGEDVYFIFTNPDPHRPALGVPDVHYSPAGDEGRAAGGAGSSGSAAANPSERTIVDPQLWKQPEGFPLKRSDGRAAGISAAYTPPLDPLNDRLVFYCPEDIEGDPDQINATCQFKEPFDDGEKTLVIFVEETLWDSGEIDSTHVAELANYFQVDGSEEDIWGWVTDIFGEPWGDHRFGNILLESGAENYITILLYDISGDGKDALENGGIVGYFDPLNNKRTASRSNKRLMFAIDAFMLADDGGNGIDSEDFWPMMVISTLAHEFQHMVHFYQKQVKNELISGGYVENSDTWMNEMCSMVAEDLLSANMGVPGPRGINPPTLMTAGSVSNTASGRLFQYNGRHDRSLTTWSDGDTVGFDYAASYSFGAFLARNYGGSALFRNIVRNASIDQQAVTEAISHLGFGNVSLEELLVKWGEAVILSDDDDPYISYDGTSMDGYNSGGAFSSSPDDPDGTGYNLGSIDLFNYQAYSDGWTGQLGPLFYVNGGDSPRRPGPASNVIFLAAENVDGDFEMEVEVPVGSILTVVTK